MPSALIRDLEGQVDTPNVSTRPADLAAYAYDAFGASGERHLPDAVVFPGSSEEVAGVVQVCAHHGVAVIPRGAGTGYSQGAVAVGGGVVVCLTRMTRVLGVERDAMRMHVEAGVITSTVHNRAAAEGLYYPPDPGASTTSTIGGNVACNAAGPHALRYGATSEYVVGATIVTGDGRIVHIGEGGDGDTGTLRLVAGSEGTLGIITQVLLRLTPAPAARITMSATFADMEAAAAAVARISAAGVVPAALEFMDAAALDAIAEAGIAEIDRAAGAMVLVEVEGDAGTTEREAEACRSALDTAGATRVDQAMNAAEAKRLWGLRKAISAAVATVTIGKVNEDVVVPRHRIAELIAYTRELHARHALPVVVFGHLGDGNLHVTFLIDPRRPGERARADAACAELFARVLEMGGALTGEHGVGTTKLPFVEQQLGADQIALMRRIKATFDPFGILNPGKKIPAAPAAATGEVPGLATAPHGRGQCIGDLRRREGYSGIMPWTLIARLLSAVVMARLLRRARPGMPWPPMSPAQMRRRGAQAADTARFLGLAAAATASLALAILLAVAAVTDFVLGPAWIGWVLGTAAAASAALSAMFGVRARRALRTPRPPAFTVISGE